MPFVHLPGLMLDETGTEAGFGLFDGVNGIRGLSTVCGSAAKAAANKGRIDSLRRTAGDKFTLSDARENESQATRNA